MSFTDIEAAKELDEACLNNVDFEGPASLLLDPRACADDEGTLECSNIRSFGPGILQIVGRYHTESVAVKGVQYARELKSKITGHTILCTLIDCGTSKAAITCSTYEFPKAGDSSQRMASGNRAGQGFLRHLRP